MRTSAFLSKGTTDFRKQRLVLALVIVIALLPFLDRAYAIDDQFFIWTAKHITTHPFDYYGFSANSYGWETPIAAHNHPPLNCYYAAFAGMIAGWSERAMHGAFLPFAIFFVIGVHELAKRHGGDPMLAALLAGASPAFLVSATSVMCDVPMVTLWIWAVIFWDRGLDSNNLASFLMAAILILASALMKYFGVALLLLLPVYSILRTRRPGWWLITILIPIAGLVLFETHAWILYGVSPFDHAARYGANVRPWNIARELADLPTALSHMGGCFAPALFFMPWIRSRWPTIGFLSFCALFALTGYDGSSGLRDENGLRWELIIQAALWSAAGVYLLLMTIRSMFTERSASTTLLCFWIVGTFLFSWLLNWSVNARSILPMIPAAAILISRVAEQSDYTKFRLIASTILSWALVMTVTASDFTLANSAREAAMTILGDRRIASSQVIFEGHWGFQYYMQQGGAEPLNIRKKTPVGSMLIIPTNNTNLYPPPDTACVHVATWEFQVTPWCTTMNDASGAGFYAADWGAVPFAFTRVPSERYDAFKVIASW